MTRTLTATTALALLLLGGAAQADCADELAAFSADRPGIAKDGSLAPLQTETGAATDDAAAGMAQTGSGEANAIAKDGSTPPLGESVGAAAGVATSQEEAEAQQVPGGADPQEDALTRARAALEAGDEQACLRALDEARAG